MSPQSPELPRRALSSAATPVAPSRYQKRHGRTPDGLSALAYDAARVLVDAFKRAGSTEGPKVRDAIASTKGFKGVTGTITIGPDRNPQGKDLVIVEVRNGQLVLKDKVAGSVP